MIERKLYPPWRALLIGLLAALLCAPLLRADEMMRQVQEELRKRHLYFGDIDGRYTPEVAAALRRYQQAKGFPPDGTADETTLRSLTLLPPAPADRTLSPLPDIPVFRSDERLPQDGASSNDVPPALAKNLEPAPTTVPLSTPTPTPAPPPASLSAQRPTPQALVAFVVAYLQAGQTNDPPAELRFYSDHVDYFDDGWVDHQFVAQDVAKYDHRWPQRQFSLAGPVDVVPVSDGDPVKTRVRFRLRYAVKNSRYSLVAQMDTEYVVAGTRPEDFRIVSLKEQRVRP